MNESETLDPLSGFIPVCPPQAQRKARPRWMVVSRTQGRRSLQMETHFYADLFGIAFGFYSKEDRDGFLVRMQPATTLPSRLVADQDRSSEYPYVVVCRCVERAFWWMEQWLFRPRRGAVHQNLIHVS